MSEATAATDSAHGTPWRSRLAWTTTVLALLALPATVLLISPPAGASFPGAVPWSDGSLLRHVVHWMSLGGAVPTPRGVEIKDLVFLLAAACGLMILTARALVSGLNPPPQRTAKGVWFAGQMGLGVWVLISAVSASWSGDPASSLGQAALYAAGLAWAISLAWTLEPRQADVILRGYLVSAIVCAILCIWFYNERNPFHRPGFPIGNPTTLASWVAPAMILLSADLIGRIRARGPTVNAAWFAQASIRALALATLLWCFVLADSRGATLGLLAAALGVAFVLVPWRVRAGLLALAGAVLVAGAWYLSSVSLDFAMSRGDTLRFRLYAWKYAAFLWGHRPVSGMGAGAYPRIAGTLDTEDRALDPAAFMAELVEHAHNELFEVFVEIGLVGGLFFVAGYVATLTGGANLTRASASTPRGMLRAGLLACLLFLLADAMFGVGLRLPGTPLIHYTLLGLLWAECRAASRFDLPRSLPQSWFRQMLLRRYAVAAGTGALACLMGWLAIWNWQAARSQFKALAALEQGDFAAARAHAESAAEGQLDPVRRIDAAELRARVSYAEALSQFERARAQAPPTASTSRSASQATLDDAARAALVRAGEAAQEAYQLAVEIGNRAPALVRVRGLGARCAEIAANAQRLEDSREAQARAREWAARALQAWIALRQARPFDRDALLAIARAIDPASAPRDLYLGLLRDALRAGPITPNWYAALLRCTAVPGVDGLVQALVLQCASFDPHSLPDSLIGSRAPEMLRLAAFWARVRNQPDRAAELSARAAELYRPLRARLPEFYSIALAEQAEALLAARPDDVDEALACIDRALAALPAIQLQKAQAMARPYRLDRAKLLAAAGREAEAIDAIQQALGEEAELTTTLASAYKELLVTFVRADPRPARFDAWIERLTELRPRNATGWRWAAWRAQERGGTAALEDVLARAAAAGLPEGEVRAIREKALRGTASAPAEEGEE